MNKTRFLLSILCIILGLTTACGSSVSAATVDLMDGISAQTVNSCSVDERFINSQAELYLKLYKDSFLKSDNQNLLISPLSVSMALSMTANGAENETLIEMKDFLGGLDMVDLNAYQRTFLNRHNNEYIKNANSIWFRDSQKLTVNKPFLQTNADYYGAGIFKAPFDKSTVKDINAWVKENTDGKIKQLIDSIDAFTVMYLINAVSFEAGWAEKYQSPPSKSIFYTASGKGQTAEMMISDEGIYLSDGTATGFIKHYKGGKYSFAALLPNENVSISDYINGLDAKSLMNTLNNAKSENVKVYMPKFSFDCDTDMTTLLKAEMPLAFDQEKADFSALGKSERGNIYIGEVAHKTNITVDIDGTKAAAVTKVEMTDKMSIMPQKEVILNRPFVFMIIDNTTKLPIFIGNLMDLQ